MKRNAIKWLSALLAACLLLMTPLALMEEAYVTEAIAPVAEAALEAAVEEAPEAELEAPVEEITFDLGGDDESALIIENEDAPADEPVFVEADDLPVEAEAALLGADDAAAAEGLPVDEANFPDEGFRAYIADNVDLDGDSVLSDAEIAEATRFEFYDGDGYPIKSLAGIEHFPELLILNVGDREVKTLDLSKNAKLVELRLWSNGLESLNVTGCPALEDLSIEYNQITELDLSGNPRLQDLYCAENRLTALDVSKNPDLEYLTCYENDLTALDVTRNPALRTLHCGDNQITALDLSKNTALEELNVMANRLTELVVSNKPTLHYIFVDKNPLTKLDVSNDPALWRLDCPSMGLTALNVKGDATLEYLNCAGNRLTTLDLTGCTDMGVLECYDNALTALDVTKLTKLSQLDCGHNAIKALDVRNCPDLTELRCQGNKIAKLDLTDHLLGLIVKPENRQDIDDYVSYEADGIYSYLNVDTSTELVTGGAADGVALDEAHFPDARFRGYLSIKADFDQNDVLSDAEIAYIKGLNISGAEIKSIEGIQYLTSTRTLGLYGSLPEGLDKARALNIVRMDVWGMQLDALDLTGFKALEHLNCSEIHLKSLNVADCAALTYLDCGENALTALDVSKNAKLEELYCAENQLTTLDVSKNTKLFELVCSDNKLTKLDVSKLTGLGYLYCEDNQLTSLDISKNAELMTVDAYKNQLTALDISRNPLLCEVLVARNKLTRLEIGNNPNLENIFCYDNAITELDLSGSPKLIWLVKWYERETGVDEGWSPSDKDYRYEYLRIGSAGEGVEVAEELRVDPDTTLILTKEGTPIDAAHFPDAAFRKYVIYHFDPNHDGALSADEAAVAYHVDAGDRFIKTLKGIELLTGVESVSVEWNNLTELDLSKNTKVKYVYCNDNQLTSLTLPMTDVVMSVSAEHNPDLKTLDIGGRSQLQAVYKTPASTVDDDTVITYYGTGDAMLRVDKALTLQDTPTLTLTSSDKHTMDMGTKLRLDLAGKEASGYKSSKTSVATVSADGVIDAVAAGSATITVTLKSKGSLKLNLTVVDPTVPTKLVIDQKGPFEHDVNKPLKLSYQLEPIDTAVSAVDWKVSPSKAATIDADG
ncbi:MAG: Ig-like domain-containing protein, partial [Clostridia bacterium]|nr:Ig-like domain-containing protein [Clostridia bacterium]